jgi:hypothetical protein
MYIKMFEEFQQEESLKKKKKSKKKTKGESIEDYPAPEYVVQPAKGDKGFFMFKAAFDNMKKRFEPGFFSTTINNTK